MRLQNLIRKRWRALGEDAGLVAGVARSRRGPRARGRARASRGRARPRSRGRAARRPRARAGPRSGSRRSRRRASAAARASPGGRGTRVSSTSAAARLGLVAAGDLVRAGRRRRCRPRGPRPSCRRAAGAACAAEQRGDADRAGALDDELGLLHAAAPSPRRSRPRRRRRRRRPSGAERERQPAGLLDRDAVGDRQPRGDLDRRARLQRRRDTARSASTWTPTTSTSGRALLTAIATPDGQPAAADRDDDLREVGDVLEQLEAERPLARRRRPGRRTGARTPCPAAAARSCAATRHSSTESPPRTTWAPSASAPSTLVSGASRGHEHLAAHAERRARRARAPSRGCRPTRRRRRWRSASPSARSLFAAPRTLNEPVRWRFSALSATGAPSALGERRRRQHRRVARDAGDRLARGADVVERRVRCVPAATALLERDHRVDLDLRALRQRGDADTRRAPAARRSKNARVDLVDLGERRRCR